MILAALLVGAGLRLVRFGQNPSLEVDELWVAAAVTAKQPKAVPTPAGFLWLTRLTVKAFGFGDRVLRLVPLVSGLAALALFLPLSRRCCTPLGAFLAALLLAISHWPVHYSVYLKQYSSDAAVSCLLWMIMLGTGGYTWSKLRYFLAGSAGMIAVWFSYPAVFVLAGTGALLLGRSIFRGERKQAMAWTVICCLWLASWGLCYQITARSVSGESYLLSYWSSAFPPLSGAASEKLHWYLHKPLEVMQDPAGFKFLPGLAVFAFLAGVASLWRSGRAWETVVLLAPLACAFLAAVIHKYPFEGRLLLFACPAIFIIIAEGCVLTWRAMKSQATAVVGAAFVLLLLGYPALDALREADAPVQEDMRSLVQRVHAARRTTDPIYVYYGALPAWEYYDAGILTQWLSSAEQNGVRDYVRGGRHRGSFVKYLQEIAPFRGKDRVWFVFSHVWPLTGNDEKQLITEYLDSEGRKMQSLEEKGASAYLYDLSSGAAGNPVKE